MKLYYIRHGDPIYEPDSLTELGHKQVKLLALRKDFDDIDIIYASSSNRAILTATPTADRIHKNINILDWCNEKYAWETATAPKENGEIRWLYENEKLTKSFYNGEIDATKKWYDDPHFSFLTKEKMIDYENKIDVFMESLGFKHIRNKGIYVPIKPKYNKVALFAHEGFGYIFLSSLLDIPYFHITRFVNKHTGVTVIDFEDKCEAIPKILSFSDVSHLYESK